MTTSVHDRVQSGIAFLDQEYPYWRDMVSADDLDMVSPDACVVGQVADDGYCQFMWRHNLETVDMVDLGFESLGQLPGDEMFYKLDVDYADLQTAWFAELTKLAK